MAAVLLSGLSKTYDRTPVLQNASLSLASGEFLTLLGPSGCGKTTLLRIVAGLIAPDSGTVKMDSRDVTATAVHRREIGMVFQAHALFPHMTVGDNVGFGLKMRGVAKAERRSLVISALTTVRLQSFYDRMPHELSGGQQQRVALARAIVIKPKVLLLDEPFGALDRKLRESLQVELREVTRQLGITAIFVTHDQEEALVLSDRVAVMNSGKIEQVDVPRAVFETPANRFVADFMGFANLRDAVVERSAPHDLALASGGLKLVADTGDGRARATGSRVGIGIRRERIAIQRAGTAPDEFNSVDGVVESSIYHGNLWSYRIATHAGALLVARPPDQSDRGAGLEVGAQVVLSWDRDSVRVFDE